MSGSAAPRAARWLARLQAFESAAAFAAFIVLVAVLFADVVSREWSGTGLLWARQLGVYANLVVVMAGLGVASASGAHFRPRFADDWIPRGWAPMVSRLADGVMAAFCLGFALVALAGVIETRLLEERSALPSWPIWPFQVIVPVAFLSVALRHVLLARWPSLRCVPRPTDPVAGDGNRPA